MACFCRVGLGLADVTVTSTKQLHRHWQAVWDERERKVQSFSIQFHEERASLLLRQNLKVIHNAHGWDHLIVADSESFQGADSVVKQVTDVVADEWSECHHQSLESDKTQKLTGVWCKFWLCGQTDR